MAYLKGDTYIDGNLNVKGKLFIQRLADAETGLGMPYLENEDSAISNRLVKFISTDGGLTSSLIEETTDNTEIFYKFYSTGSSTTTLDFTGKFLNLDNINELTINTPVANINMESSELRPLAKYTGSGTPSSSYYYDGANYYIVWVDTGAYRNHPVKFCYTNQLIGG